MLHSFFVSVITTLKNFLLQALTIETCRLSPRRCSASTYCISTQHNIVRDMKGIWYSSDYHIPFMSRRVAMGRLRVGCGRLLVKKSSSGCISEYVG